MTESKGVKAADALMRKLIKVPKAEVSNTPPPKPKKNKKGLVERLKSAPH